MCDKPMSTVLPASATSLDCPNCLTPLRFTSEGLLTNSDDGEREDKDHGKE